MGNSQPVNRTGKKQEKKKLENAVKLGVLSLTEHGLESVPDAVFAPELQQRLKTLDLSHNKLTKVGDKLSLLRQLKTLNLDHNQLPSGSLKPVQDLSNLQSLSACNNRLGKPSTNGASAAPLPTLPASIKQIQLAGNFFSSVPPTLMAPSLVRLEKLNLSRNQLAAVPDAISNLSGLQELLLDDNAIVALPASIGKLTKLKVLSLRRNKIRVESTHFSATHPQPLPASLFSDTALIDLNLHGNDLTNTQINEFGGYSDFLDRRQKVKSKTLTNLDVCGLN